LLLFPQNVICLNDILFKTVPHTTPDLSESDAEESVGAEADGNIDSSAVPYVAAKVSPPKVPQYVIIDIRSEDEVRRYYLFYMNAMIEDSRFN